MKKESMDDYYYFDDEKYIQESEYDEYNGEGSRTTDEERPLKLFQVEEKQGTNENNNARRARTCSETWKYFNTQDTQHPTKVICKKCNQMYSKSTGFNILKTHLLSVHGIKIDNVKKMQTELNFLKFDPLPKEEKLARDQALVDWIIADSQPISVVTNIHFINSIKALDPRYHLPGKTSVEEMVLERFNEMRKNVKLEIDKIPGKVSLTSDMWTSALTDNYFLDLTIHFIDKEWQHQHFLLDIISFNDHHAAINITDAIVSILTEFNIKEKVLALTTDNEDTMLTVGRLVFKKLECDIKNPVFKHYRCAAHILNSAAQQGLELIDDTIVKLRRLMKKIKQSVTISDELRNLCQFANIDYLSPELDVKTRWNSTYNMLKKMETMWSGIQMLAVNNQEIRILMPTEIDWNRIKVC
ncbi:7041_t:CDS:1 [Funneliformis geosporum]|nr:7041_t:CDS:1 [Funneliformis geosporum]